MTAQARPTTPILIDVRDVGMIEPRSGLRLLDKAPHALLNQNSNFGRKNLDRDFAIQLGVFRQRYTLAIPPAPIFERIS